MAAPAPRTGPMGIAGRLPRPFVPLGFLAASGVGLVAFGVSVAVRAERVIAGPLSLDVVAVVHLAMLGFLSTAVVGALHQFTPVITSSSLRSNAVAAVTLPGWLAGAWLLPLGFALNSTPVIVVGGTIAVAFAYVTVWNVSGPLSKPSDNDSVVGLRSAVAFFALTVTFGIVYAFDLHHGWFPLLPTRVLAHALLGLLGWIGLAYVAVAERLWPMFLLAHKKGRSAGAFAVRLVPPGVLVLVTGVLFRLTPVAAVGAVVTAAGLFAHLASLTGYVRLRRRRIELLQWYVIASSAFLAAAVLVGTFAGVARISSSLRVRLVSVFVAAVLAWLGLAVVGHAHKIVPFIVWTSLRSRGRARRADGRPIVFGDLSNVTAGWVTFLSSVAGSAALSVGIATSSAFLVATGGLCLAIAAGVALANLGLTPVLASRRFGPGPSRTAGAGLAPATANATAETE